MTLRFPFPKWPCIHMTYCRYAACLIALLSYVGVKTYVSAKLLIAVPKLSESKQMFWNANLLLWHNRLSLQHTLSLSVGISWQNPHTQNGALVWALTSSTGFSSIFFTKSFSTNGLDLKPSFATLIRVSLSKPSIIS